jgi:hypothetical protein
VWLRGFLGYLDGAHGPQTAPYQTVGCTADGLLTLTLPRPLQVNNYQDKNNVQYCDLEGLPDLSTASGYVQTTISTYMNTLSKMGAAGFRWGEDGLGRLR